MWKSRNIKYSIAAFCLIVAIYLAYDLYTLYHEQTLWGNRLLWFWIFSWTALLIFTDKFFSDLPQNKLLVFASCLSGLLLGVGFMNKFTFLFIFVGFLPLLWVENVLSKHNGKNTVWVLFKFSFNTFFIWNILSTWWIQNSSLVAGVFGNILNSIFMCIPIILYHITKKNVNQRSANYAFVSYWLTFEIGHMTWDLSWPWLTLGNSFAVIPAFIQWYEISGVFGGSLWVLLVNIIVTNYYFLYQDNKITFNTLKFKLIFPLILILFPIITSLLIYYSFVFNTENQIEIVSIQPNYEPHYKKFTIPQNKQFAHLIELTQNTITDSTLYVVMPETSFRNIEANKLQKSSIIQGLSSFVKNYPNLNLILGISSYIRYSNEEPKPDHIYTYCNEDKSFCQYIDSHNSAIQINNESKEIPYYKKSKLVPGAESMPYIGNLDLFKGLILDMGGAPGLSLGIQNEREVFKSKTSKIAPMICYESVFGNYVTGYTNKGAEAFFVITNDGWWDNTVGHRQHMYLSSLRAIENRRYVVRSANSGISCFINSRGDIYNSSNYDESIALRDNIYLIQEITFYCKYGDLIGRVSILLSILLFFSMIAKGLRKENSNN
ncbi:MAG: apolipoprotein N-acyltransferase [Saprospiraceae bacterium]|nr:apolipoprotein N-acyltransferase [Saprospiraceae bacterium]